MKISRGSHRALALALVILFSLTACGRGDTEETEEDEDVESTSSTLSGTEEDLDTVQNPTPTKPITTSQQSNASALFGNLKEQLVSCAPLLQNAGPLLNFLMGLLKNGRGVAPAIYTKEFAGSHGILPSPRGASCLGGLGNLVTQMTQMWQSGAFGQAELRDFLRQALQWAMQFLSGQRGY